MTIQWKTTQKPNGYVLNQIVDQNPHGLDTYLGNPQVKRHKVSQPWTEEELDEYVKCKNDVVYFAEKYVKVVHVDWGLVDFKLYPYQKKMMRHFDENNFAIVLACRQSGKSISSIAYLLHFVLFNSDKFVAILANKGATSKEMLGRLILAFENLPFFLQPGAKALNKGSIELSNGSRIESHSTSSSSIRGKSASLIYLDEFAFVHNDEEFYTSTYPVITSGQNSRVIITSTANGIANKFYGLWQGAVQGTSSYKPFRVDWWDVPGRDQKWKEMTIANTSEAQFEQEFGNNFGGTSNTLINGNILLGIRAENPLEEYRDIKIYERPAKDRKYVLACDVAKGRLQDYSAFSVIDITETPYKQVATYRSNSVSPLLLPDVVWRAAKFYNDAYTVIEANDQGALVYKILYYEYEYEHMYSGKVVNGRSMGLEMTKSVKRIGCSHLKDLIEQEQFVVTDFDTIVELSLFEAKGDSYSARDGHHDDTVMALVSFAWLANTPLFSGMTNGTMRDVLSAERQRLIDESVPAFGVMDSNLEQELFTFLDSKGEVTERFKGIDDVFGKEFGVVKGDDEYEDDPTRWLF